MLGLSRKVGDAIQIGNTIEGVMLAVEGQKVKFGIRAPRETSILKSELINFEFGNSSPMATR